ncbi:type I pullulanase [Bacillus atrophaeus]|uniref:type I pullulanase n=1 Tax=Bacillus atrophaeus TaxID=1452 RepID=UPI002DB9AE67|nr:type I pullulanase [Bacillus atrophaeus]MEC2306815.1 type I pullulanase [Bacillus atrophaeus]
MVCLNRKFEAYLDEMDVITVLIPSGKKEKYTLPFVLETEAGDVSLSIRAECHIDGKYKYILVSEHPVSLGKTHYIRASGGDKTDLQIGAVIRTEAFDSQFYFDGALGADYTPSRTVFKVWAPTATAAAVKLTHPEQQGLVLQMTRQDHGVFAALVDGDLHGYEYMYRICNNLEWTETADPYAKAVTINGEKGVVLRPENPHITSQGIPFSNPADAVIYEVHIRDFSIHENSGMKKKGQYLAMTETDAKTREGVSAGLSYLKELGVTHIELLPVNDFAGVDEKNPLAAYNWGYNPLHFFAPEGSYSSDPYNPQVRKSELKKLIQTLHQNGLQVILDVVYNHVYKREHSPFENTVPGYFFRHDADGMPSNGTGVGNDIASERLMARKYIIDCVVHWLKEYDADGFRFDLMGILDIETVRQIRERALAVKPGILLFGEGWNLDTPISDDKKATLANAFQLPGIGFFNDSFRDAVKGSTFQREAAGFTLGNGDQIDAVIHGITGSAGWKETDPIVQEPSQSVNYVESHDNHTFWDKMQYALPHETDSVKRSRQKLATAVVLLAQGIPFIHSGQEFFRTKQGDENSYQSGDSVNRLDWTRRSEFREDVEYVRRLIEIRKAHPAFRLKRAAEVVRHLDFLEARGHLIAYRLFDLETMDEWKEIIIVHHSSPDKAEMMLPAGKTYRLLCDPSGFREQPKEIKEELIIEGIGTCILYI